MKKSISVLITTFLVFGLFLGNVSKVEAYAEDGDCTCTANSSAWISAARPNGLTQYFKPIRDHLVKMQAVIRSESAGNYRLSIKKGSDVLLTQDFAGSGGGSTTYKMIDGFDISVTPGEWYQMQLDNLSGNTGWYYKLDPDCYPEGYAYYDGAIQSDRDFWFYTWGYDDPPPATPTPTPTPTPTSTSSSQPTTSPSPSAAPVDESVQKPVLTSIEKNGQKTNAPIKDEVKISSNDTLKLVGTSFTGAKVTIFVGNYSYSATVDTKGDWTFNLPVSKIKDGSFTVSAQAVNDKGKGSEKVTFFKLKKEDTKATTTSPTQKPKTFWQKLFTTYLPYTVGLLIVLLSGIGMLIYHLIQKKRKPKVKIDE